MAKKTRKAPKEWFYIKVYKTGQSYINLSDVSTYVALGTDVTRPIEELVFHIDYLQEDDLILSIIRQYDEDKKEIRRLKEIISDYRAASEKIMAQ